jgi:signal transduction histidine kinase
MNHDPLSAEWSVPADRPAEAPRRLRGAYLLVARTLWIIIVLLTLGMFLPTLPAMYENRLDDENALPRRWAAVHVDGPAGNGRDDQALEALFSRPLETVGPIRGAVTHVGAGCESDLPDFINSSSTIALMDRGGCRFDQKIRNAEQAGAVAVIVADNHDAPLNSMTGRIPVGIPAVSITRAAGQTLAHVGSSEQATVTLAAVAAEPGTLEQLGLSRDLYAAYQFALDIVGLPIIVIAALVIFWRRSDDWFALLISLTMVTFATPVLNISALVGAHPLWRVAAELIANFGWISIFATFFLLFPDGRFVPRWSWILAVLFAAWILKDINLSGIVRTAPPASVDPLNLGVQFGFYAAGLAAQVYRYRRVSTPLQRQQTKWIVLGLVLGVVGAFGPSTLRVLFPALNPPGIPSVVYGLIGRPVEVLLGLLWLVAIALAILQHRLWDIDLVIRRTLVYGALTASVVGLYVLVVGGLGAVFQSSGNLAISLLATGLIAVLFQPLRERLQRGVNHLLYGQRDEPYRVLSRLMQRLEGTLAPEAVLPSIIQTVQEALKLPYAAIALRQADTLALAAASGEPSAEVLRLPLVYQHESVGELRLGPRGPGEAWSPADRQLLGDLARQAGVAAHAVRLAAELQHSRERLVSAREEERRRLRRDLHDELAPTLAALALTAATARDRTTNDPTATALLEDLYVGLRSAVGDIRRLVYELRPPALDELGLVAAMRERAAAYNGSRQAELDGLQVTVVAPECLPPLPAAVEVAAYRIVQEALMNVARHAQAHTCTIRLALADGLQVEVSDDGVGLPETYRAGVGLASMRERALELGGRFRIERRNGVGTLLQAWLPLSKEESDGANAHPAGR